MILSMDKKIKKISVGIIGANGYTGHELLRLLGAHPYAVVTYAASRSLAGTKISDLFTSLSGLYGDRLFDGINLEKLATCDVVFAALPHGESASICGKLIDLGTKVIDLSADFRYDDLSVYESTYKINHPRTDLCKEAVYGLCEFNRDIIAKARLIGNPGCYVTSSVLAIKPLSDAGYINKKTVIIDAKSGVSGAGRNADVAYNYNEIGSNATIKNEFIAVEITADNVAGTLSGFLKMRNLYDNVQNRGFPEIDAGDTIFFQSNYNFHFPAFVLANNIKFNGTFSGTMKLLANDIDKNEESGLLVDDMRNLATYTNNGDILDWRGV